MNWEVVVARCGSTVWRRRESSLGYGVAAVRARTSARWGRVIGDVDNPVGLRQVPGKNYSDLVSLHASIRWSTVERHVATAAERDCERRAMRSTPILPAPRPHEAADPAWHACAIRIRPDGDVARELAFLRSL